MTPKPTRGPMSQEILEEIVNRRSDEILENFVEEDGPVPFEVAKSLVRLAYREGRIDGMNRATEMLAP